MTFYIFLVFTLLWFLFMTFLSHQDGEHTGKASRELAKHLRFLGGDVNDLNGKLCRIAHIVEVDVSTDTAFQKKFTSFYRVGRDDRWRREFYCLFEECKTVEALSFQYILQEMFNRTGRIEASFSSKLLATLNPQMPILDSIGSFHLKQKDKDYIREKGMDVIREHAKDFIAKREALAVIPNDGKQTPMRGRRHSPGRRTETEGS